MDQAMSLPDDFQTAYDERDKYPRNLIQRTIGTIPSALTAIARTLDVVADDLCETDTKRVEVCFRDLGADDGKEQAVKKRNIHSPIGLTEWLGISRLANTIAPDSQRMTAVRKDPKCRFVYIYGENTRARLKITRSMLTEILTFHQVMPDFLDFIFTFGLQSEQRDLAFSSFRQQVSLKPVYERFEVANLGRSGRQYQLCYNLKGVTATSTDPDDAANNEFSIRPAAFYHRFDAMNGNTLWVVTKGGPDIMERFKELTGKEARPEDKSFGSPAECFRSSISAHLMFCHWSTEDWRGYIKWLEFVVDRETKMAVVGPTNRGYHYDEYTAEDIQRILNWQEKVSGVISALESNEEVMQSLKRFYIKLSENEDFGLRKTCNDDIDEFASHLSNMLNDIKLQISRARALGKLTTDRGELVKQHRLERLNQNMEKEAIMVRIVTIVTLIYLPATFVSTFFSTDIIKYQGQESPKGHFSIVAMERWLQVTVPLTFFTLLIAYLGNRWAGRRAATKPVESGETGKLVVSTAQCPTGASLPIQGPKRRRLPTLRTPEWCRSLWTQYSIPLGPMKPPVGPAQIV